MRILELNYLNTQTYHNFINNRIYEISTVIQIHINILIIFLSNFWGRL